MSINAMVPPIVRGNSRQMKYIPYCGWGEVSGGSLVNE